MARGTLSGRRFGKYKLRHLLGKGGMGEVYLAFQHDLERDVAFKVLLDLSEVNHKERFLREAKIAASLEHPNIVPVYDFGIDTGFHYIVMRLMTGGSLESRLTAGYLPLDETVDLLRQLADALDYAHSRGIVHRDIKPSNVLFDRHDRPYLADFGIATLLNTVSNLTASGKIVGTPPFIAPELWQDKDASPATDLYALGILVYKMLTGKMPFSAESPYAFMLKHLSETPTAPQTIRSDIPDTVQGVLEKALAKEPQNRFVTATEFSHALAVTVSQASARTMAVVKPSIPVAPTSSATLDGETTPVPPQINPVLSPSTPALSSESRVKSGYRGIWIVLGLILTVIVLGGALLSTSIFGNKPTATAPMVESATLDSASISIIPSATIAATETLSYTPSPLPTPTHKEVEVTAENSTATPSPFIVAVPGVVTPSSQTVQGTLTQQQLTFQWPQAWKAGEVYSICGRSRDFDIYLTVQSPNGSIAQNDDSLGTTDACITAFIVEESGTYHITVTSYDRQSTGDYSIDMISHNQCARSTPAGYVVASAEVNLRNRPTTFSDLVSKALPNECFAIVGRDDKREWWKIKMPNGRIAWIAASLIEVIGDSEAVPVLTE